MTDPRRWTAGVRRERLPNGLTLLVQRDDSAPVAAVVTHVRAGFLDEPDEWVGLSHVLEHMFFKGTPTRGVGAVAKETKSLGGYLNASTSYDRTSYYVVVPARNLAQAIDIQADALQHATLDPEELARELRVIIEEAKRKRDTASAVASETVHQLLFDAHRLRRWRIGEEDALAQFTGDQLRAYYRSRYVPERTIVSIVASAPEDEVLALARAAYDRWPPRATSVLEGPDEPRHAGVRVRTLRGDVKQGDLVLGWRGVPPLDADETALEMAAGVLSVGRGSRLHRRLREPGIATSVGAWHYSQERVGVFAVHAAGDPARVGEMLDGAAAEIAALRERGPSDAEVERTRTLLCARWARQFESYEGRASALASAEALGGVHLIDDEYARLGAVTAAEVTAAAFRHLDPDAVGAVAYLPGGAGDDLAPDAVRMAFAPASAEGVAVPELPRAAGPRAIRGARRVTAEVLHLALDGADILVRRRANTPLVTTGVYLPRVEWETNANAGIGALTVRALVRGAGAFDGTALALASEGLGGSIAPFVGSDWVGLSLTALDEQAGRAAALLQLTLSDPRLTDEGVVTERDLLLEEARHQADDMLRYPLQLALAGAFGPRGYGLPVGGTMETLPGLGPDAARRWHAANLVGIRPAIVVVGDGELDRLADRIAPAFAALPAGRRPAPRAELRWAVGAAPAMEAVPREKRQTAFAMAFPGPSRVEADRPAAEVWAAIASGLGGRLFDALRDRRSLAYTVLASAWPRAVGGAIVTYIATAPEREDEAREEMLRELARFTESRPDFGELSQGRNYLSGQAEVERQSAGALAGEIVQAWFAGRGLEELAEPGREYRAVTGDDVLAAARRYLDPARRAEGVVRGKPAA